jgi:hypothetical protein
MSQAEDSINKGLPVVHESMLPCMCMDVGLAAQRMANAPRLLQDWNSHCVDMHSAVSYIQWDC